MSAVKREIDSFAGGTEQADDMTMLALEVKQYGPDDNYGLLEDCDRLDEADRREPAMKKLLVGANPDKLNEVLDFVNTELERISCPQILQGQIDVAVDEIFTNIVSYAYASEAGSVSISIGAGEEVVIRFEDSGKPYDPLEHAPPDFHKPLEDRTHGGLGIYLVKHLMDKVDYSRVNDKNVLTMTKKINQDHRHEA